jgi:hypothetical protein
MAAAPGGDRLGGPFRIGDEIEVQEVAASCEGGRTETDLCDFRGPKDGLCRGRAATFVCRHETLEVARFPLPPLRALSDLGGSRAAGNGIAPQQCRDVGGCPGTVEPQLDGVEGRVRCGLARCRLPDGRVEHGQGFRLRSVLETRAATDVVEARPSRIRYAFETEEPGDHRVHYDGSEDCQGVHVQVEGRPGIGARVHEKPGRQVSGLTVLPDVAQGYGQCETALGRQLDRARCGLEVPGRQV